LVPDYKFALWFTHEKMDRKVKKIAPMMFELAKLNISSLLLHE
jgi:hypothetical protein